MKNEFNFVEDVKNQLINAINSGRLTGIDIDELHHEVYNSLTWLLQLYLIFPAKKERKVCRADKI